MRTYQKPLGRSIAIGCILFTAILCISLSVLNYYNQKSTLYKRYESYITDILEYVDSYIDDEDLKACIETTTESEKYQELLRFMDRIMNTFDIHYLYVIKPLNLNETGNVLSVLSAEDDYNRYVDTEGNLYLGWISDDEYDVETVRDLFDIMERDGITFFTEKTEWSTDYTGALPLQGEDGEAYAILAVDVDITTLSSELWQRALFNAGVIVLLGFLYTAAFLYWTRNNITHPVKLLEQGVVDFADRSHGQRDINALAFSQPDIRTENEIKSLSDAITCMTKDMQDYVSDILSAEKETQTMKELADAMSELAIKDSLTGIRNKTAYDREVVRLEKELAENSDLSFGIAIIDLNFLKKLNDTYGHEKGDAALRTLSGVICRVFSHSPVFRIGGDEFAVILKGQDYENIDALKDTFLRQITESETGEGREQLSAAIGIARYDKTTDDGIGSVSKRADQAMYDMKIEMKAVRQD